MFFVCFWHFNHLSNRVYYLASIQSLFDTAAIDFSIWLRILLVASSVLFLVELEKYFMRRDRAN